MARNADAQQTIRPRSQWSRVQSAEGNRRAMQVAGTGESVEPRSASFGALCGLPSGSTSKGAVGLRSETDRYLLFELRTQLSAARRRGEWCECWRSA
jgi:hypothetical protein